MLYLTVKGRKQQTRVEHCWMVAINLIEEKKEREMKICECSSYLFVNSMVSFPGW